MKKITKKNIRDLEKRLAEEQANEHSDIKRITFLKATINSYSKQLRINLLLSPHPEGKSL